jgi:acyl-CoA thioesterase I
MRHSRPQICSALIVGAIALGSLIAAAKAPVRAAAETAAAEADAVPCVAPADLARLQLPLKRTSHQLASRKLTIIVALGSSSTAGVGASSPEAAYPSRLMVELGQRFPTEPLLVLNRGVAGARAVDMVASLDESVATDHPDLVLWQLGTNAVLRGYEHARSDIVIRQGIEKIKAIGADTVLIDPQYAPKVIEHRQIQDMIGLISNAAAKGKVDVFHRFALMRYWHEQAGMPFEAFLSPDGLHMNDWAHSCLATALADAIADAAAPDHTRGNESSQLDNAAGDKGGADHCSRTGAIFNNYRLTKLGRELIENHTRHDIDDAPGGKGDNRSDRSGRPSLCPRLSAREGEAKNRQQYEANPRHAVFPRIEAGIAWKSAARRQPLCFRFYITVRRKTAALRNFDWTYVTSGHKQTSRRS